MTNKQYSNQQYKPVTSLAGNKNALAHYSHVATIKYDMWQSRVEIEGYSVAYFDRIASFEAPYC